MFVGVTVGVLVAVLVGVTVGVRVGVRVGVTVGVLVGVEVAVDGAGVNVGVGVGGFIVCKICNRKSAALFGSMRILMLKTLAKLSPAGKLENGKSTLPGPPTVTVCVNADEWPAVSTMVIVIT